MSDACAAICGILLVNGSMRSDCSTLGEEMFRGKQGAGAFWTSTAGPGGYCSISPCLRNGDQAR